MTNQAVIAKGSAVSILIPFYNEEACLPALLGELLPVLERLDPESEVIFIDDGSTDRGSEIIRLTAEKNRQIKLISFRKNFGQTAAWAAGMDYASGRTMVFLDADLQNDPADILLLVQKMEEGHYDAVSGWRKNRQDKLLTRKIPSWAANFLISKVTGVRLHDYGCSLKAYRREVLQGVNLYGEMHRFLPAYAVLEGAKILEIPVNHRPRTAGKSKYGLSRTFKVILDLITVKFLGGFSTKPIYAFGALGGITFFLGLITFVIVAYRALILGRTQATPMVFLMVIFLITSTQFIMMGLLAEIIVRIYHEASRKSTYRIKNLVNVPREIRRRRRA